MEDCKLSENKANKLLETIGYEAELAAGMHIVHKYSNGVTIFGSARVGETDNDYKLAQKLGFTLGSLGYTVTTGGGGGIMEAANRGAKEAGGVSIGFNISLPREQKLNAYTTDNYQFSHFFTRKQCLVNISKAFVFFPGGFGTLDELTDILTQIQTGKLSKLPVILYGSSFWNPLMNFIDEKLLSHNFINETDRDLFTVTNSLDEVIKMIKE